MTGRVFFMSLGSIVRTVIAVGALVFGTSASADWVNLGGAEVAPNIAEIEVQDDGVHVRLEVFVGDLAEFSDLVPAAWLTDSGVSNEADRARIERFSQKGLSIQPVGAGPLVAQVLTVERRMRIDRASPAAGTVDPYSGRLLPAPPDDPRVMFVELFYPFEDLRPDALTIAPPLDPDGLVRTSIGMVVFHRAVPVIDFRFLSAPATLTLDWDDPWNSSFDNPNLVRHHRYPRMVFLYAEPYEIRQEALVRVRDAADLVGLKGHTGKLAPDQAQALSLAAAEELGQRSRMTIDDNPTVPDFDRSAFMRIGMRGLEFLEAGEAVDVDADILGLIWSTPVDGLPQQAQLEWDWFDETAPEIAAYSIDAAGPFLSPLTKEEPVLLWKNHFKVNPYPDVAEVMLAGDRKTPILVFVFAGIGLSGSALAVFGFARRQTSGRLAAYAGAGLALIGIGGAVVTLNQGAKRIPDLAPEEIATLTEDLLGNVYRSFDFKLEDQVYDRLALTLSGDILEDVFLSQRESLKVERAGGADATVEQIAITSVEQRDEADPGTLGLKADWVVQGSVGHWGHVHRRSNAYSADLTLSPVDGAWKIVGFDVLSQERMQ